jgi:stearoyl-CoA desaturase (delta-9 desaturase)
MSAPAPPQPILWRFAVLMGVVHLAAIAMAIHVGWVPGALAWLLTGYAWRMFIITAGLHRYFSHRTYKTSRAFQFVLALLATGVAQQGPLWWAAHHRNHHAHSDQPEDTHSPVQRGFLWSHVGWLFTPAHRTTDLARVRDLAKFPELRLLDEQSSLFAALWALGFYLVGGLPGVTWGFLVPVVLCWHVTFCINSLAHVWGSRRYATGDQSRNNWVLALLTFGEGWHNNHHHYQRSARQGFFAWELDLSYLGLRLLAALRIVWDLQGVPPHVRAGVAAPGRTRLQLGLAPDDGAPRPATAAD